MGEESFQISDRLAQRAGDGGRVAGPSARRCEAKGCNAATREGKPYCPDHVELNPYVANLLKELEDLSIERGRVRGLGNSKNAAEIMVALNGRGGTASVSRLARDLHLEVQFVEKVLIAMTQTKPPRIVLVRTNRGQLMARAKE